MEINTVRNVAARMETHTLRHVCKTLEAEMLALIQGGLTRGTQAHVGMLEMMQACGAELDARGALLPPPPFVDVCVEDGIRYSMQVRVW